jgi:glycosyltransferase involved in cell wall biosynthesis
MRPNPALRAWAHEALAGCLQVVAGSHHVAGVVQELVGVPASQVCVIPPGVDTDEMRPMPWSQALEGLLAESRADGPNLADPRAPDNGNAERLAAFFERYEHPAIYVGKLSQEKGVPLLIDVLQDLRVPAVIVGFGPARHAIEPGCGAEILFTGPLQHRHLRYLWPLGRTSVAPSVFPEAFGMVAAEAASCGCPPLVAEHSGLAEIAEGLRRHYPAHLADLAAFPRGDATALADRLQRLITLPADDRSALDTAARRAAVELWSWDSVGQRITRLAGDLLGAQ